jgi:C_GCAxxG_C_C family probable redox protein
MNESLWIEKARLLFLTTDNSYGCAETAYIVLKDAYELPDASDSSAAMALNGGVAYSGGICGALTGAAIAVGILAERRITDHKTAKRASRRIIASVMDRFQVEFSSLDCRELTGLNLRDEAEHRRFIDSNLWRDGCMRQIEMVLNALLPIRELDAWEQTISTIQNRNQA